MKVRPTEENIAKVIVLMERTLSRRKLYIRDIAVLVGKVVALFPGAAYMQTGTIGSKM